MTMSRTLRVSSRRNLEQNMFLSANPSRRLTLFIFRPVCRAHPAVWCCVHFSNDQSQRQIQTTKCSPPYASWDEINERVVHRVASLFLLFLDYFRF